jgi:hypothetical protein
MTLHRASHFGWQVGLFGLITLALFSFAAAVFLFAGDDFVLGGEVIPATDARITSLRIGAIAAGIVSTVLAWLCYRHMQRLS